MNLSDVTIASSAWPMSSPPKWHYISFIWYVHVAFLLAKKILTELLFIPVFMFIYSRVSGWYLFWIFTIYMSPKSKFVLYIYIYMYIYIDVFTVLLLSNENEGRVFTSYLWKSLFLPLVLRRKCRQREVVWSWSNTCGQGLVPLIKKHSGGYYSVDQKKIFKWHGAWEYTLINMCKWTWRFTMWMALLGYMICLREKYWQAT